ncbi:MAG TPA: hypothetical protein PK640_09170, partial [Verrucomicrobiota bacterium]|nr:hypothetical protein [Verrucomicrobiota bacterium]
NCNRARPPVVVTLPAAYQDGATVATPDGRARLQFAPLEQESLDALVIDGQVVPVPAGRYESLDLALLAAPGAFMNPFATLEFQYADGSKEAQRFGPVPGWFSSPTAFDHTVFRYTDDSQVQSLVNFATDFGAEEANFLFQERGNGNSGGNRFVDGTGYVLYRIGELEGVQQAKLGVTVGNNFVISLATAYWDPEVSTTDGYTVVANSMEIYDGVEHRALGNLKQYDFDLAPYLAQGTGELYILFTDATTSNGWGPFIQRISVFTGTALVFEETLMPAVDASQATVHAMFLTGGNDDETPYLYDNSGSGPSNRGHRFADGTQWITYRFDLPDEVTNAKLVMDLANNFVVSLAGASDLVHYHSMTVGTADEATYLVDAGGSIAGGDYRFADGTAYMTYEFDLPDDAVTAYAHIVIGNEFVIEAAAGTEGAFEVRKDWVAETGEETHDNSNLAEYTIDLAPHLAANPSKIVQLRFRDGVPTDGWGPYLKRIVITNQEQTTGTTFEEVLNAQQLFGEDIRTEYNKGYYTVDLSSRLAGNPRKEVFVRFTDGSTADGWGPGIFWMAVYSGELDVLSDQLVFPDLKTTLGDPANYGACLLHRRYPLNASKTASAIALPAQPASESNRTYLLAATLNTAEPPPSIQIALAPDGKLKISWPATQVGYRLLSAASLTAPISWTDAPGTPQEVGGAWVIEVTPNAAAGYYRIVK